MTEFYESENLIDEKLVLGRNSVLEAIKCGNVDKLFVLDGCHDGIIETIKREAKKRNIITNYVSKQRLTQISNDSNNQGVVAYKSAANYFSIDDILDYANSIDEDPFVLILDHIEDPHNLGAIIRTANLVGIHGVIIPDRRAVTLTPTVAKVSSGAIEYVKVAKVKNLANTIEYLKSKGLWIACADLDGDNMYQSNLTGPIGLVMGAEGKGVSDNIIKHSDFKISIPMVGNIDSLNVSVATSVLSYEIFRQRKYKNN